MNEEKLRTKRVLIRQGHREGMSPAASSPDQRKRKCIRELFWGNYKESIQNRGRALYALRERLRPLKRVEPRVNPSLMRGFIRFLCDSNAAAKSQWKGVCILGFIRRIKEEIQIIRERDPAIHSSMEVFLYPSFKVMLHYRLAHRLYEKEHFFLARFISQRGVRKTGIEIHPGAQIGKGFFIDHGNGVIIGETTVIGNNVTLYQGVTLGGTGKEHGKRHPTIGDNVMISAGAKVLGSFTIGENSKIGAGSVVLSEVPPDSTVVGVPGRVVKRCNQPLPRETMNQTDLPDPVREDIVCLQKANTELTNRLLDMENQLKQMREKMLERNYCEKPKDRRTG